MDSCGDFCIHVVASATGLTLQGHCNNVVHSKYKEAGNGSSQTKYFKIVLKYRSCVDVFTFHHWLFYLKLSRGVLTASSLLLSK